MLTNAVEVSGNYRRIVIHRNEVMISVTSKGIDYESESQQRRWCFKKKYQIINQIIIGEHKIAQCLGEGEITIFSITNCQKICVVPQNAKVNYFVVLGELFVKITDESQQSIYDEIGNLIEIDDENDLAVKFLGCNIVLQKTNKKSRQERYYSLEGCLI